jgi:transcriptional regulator with XRE-family HTH domain
MTHTGRPKLTEPEVRDLLAKHAAGRSYKQLAAEFSISKQQVARIVTGESWSSLMTDERLAVRGAALLTDTTPTVTFTQAEIDALRKSAAEDPPDALDAYLNRNKSKS